MPLVDLIREYSLDLPDDDAVTAEQREHLAIEEAERRLDREDEV